MLRIEAIPALKDNYIWALVRDAHCIVVDPGEAGPILAWMQASDTRLAAVLVTHHHGDHVGGIAELIRRHPAPVYGPAHEAIAGVDHPVSDGQRIEVPELGIAFEVLAIPGHTRGHLAYHGENALFCGDTLFAAGCGRLFEGSPAQMHASLMRLAALPEATEVYCAHEYTLGNLAFALSLEPDHPGLRQRALEAQALRRAKLPTLPSTIGLEQATNPFLRCHEAAIRRAAETHAGHPLTDPVAVFAVVREMKNQFRQ